MLLSVEFADAEMKSGAPDFDTMATGAPQSCPAMTATDSPNTSSNPTMSQGKDAIND
jgi:hypothetical protein